MLKDIISIGCAFILLLVFMYFTIDIEVHTYEYIDLDNNKGLAKECSYKFQEHRSGGQGSPVCVLEDGTVIQVKQYKLIDYRLCKIYDEECMR